MQTPPARSSSSGFSCWLRITTALMSGSSSWYSTLTISLASSVRWSTGWSCFCISVNICVPSWLSLPESGEPGATDLAVGPGPGVTDHRARLLACCLLGNLMRIGEMRGALPVTLPDRCFALPLGNDQGKRVVFAEQDHTNPEEPRLGAGLTLPGHQSSLPAIFSARSKVSTTSSRVRHGASFHWGMDSQW